VKQDSLMNWPLLGSLPDSLPGVSLLLLHLVFICAPIGALQTSLGLDLRSVVCPAVAWAASALAGWFSHDTHQSRKAKEREDTNAYAKQELAACHFLFEHMFDVWHDPTTTYLLLKAYALPLRLSIRLP